MPHAPSSHVLLMPNLNHLTHGISNLVSLIIKTKLGLSPAQDDVGGGESSEGDRGGKVVDRLKGQPTRLGMRVLRLGMRVRFYFTKKGLRWRVRLREGGGRDKSALADSAWCGAAVQLRPITGNRRRRLFWDVLLSLQRQILWDGGSSCNTSGVIVTKIWPCHHMHCKAFMIRSTMMGIN
jgi:hypothetical protein